MDSSQFLCKVVLIGDSGVGKTSVLNKRVYDKFSFQTTTTIQAQASSLKLKANGQEVCLKLWDTVQSDLQAKAGQEKFRTITIQFYRETKGAFLLFDMTDKQTFENIKFWARQLRNHGGDDIVKILLGNKCDLEAKVVVQESEIRDLAQSLNAQFMIVSAYTNKNIIEAFDLMASELAARLKRNSPTSEGGKTLSQPNQSVLEQTQKKEGSCC